MVELGLKLLQGKVRPNIVEAIGVKVLSWIKECNMENVAVESDCQVVVKAVLVSIQNFRWSLLLECQSHIVGKFSPV